MPSKSGLGASVGASKESTYGTYVAPARHYPFTAETLKRSQDYYRSKSLQAGSVAQQKALVRQTTRSGAGNVNFTAVSKGMGLIFDALTPGVVTPSGAGAAKTFVFPIGGGVPDGKSATWQVGVPDVTGTTQVKTGTGGVPTMLKLSMAVGGALEVELGLAFQDIDYTQTLATPTYATGYEIFGFKESIVTFDGGAVGACVNDIEMTFMFPKKTDRHCLNGSGTPLEPISNDHITLNGKATLEFTGLTEVNAFKNATWRAMNLQNRGLIDIQTGIKPELSIAIPDFLVSDDATPMVSGPDVISLPISFETAVSSSVLANITYITSDTAI